MPSLYFGIAVFCPQYLRLVLQTGHGTSPFEILEKPCKCASCQIWGNRSLCCSNNMQYRQCCVVKKTVENKMFFSDPKYYPVSDETLLYL